MIHELARVVVLVLDEIVDAVSNRSLATHAIPCNANEYVDPLIIKIYDVSISLTVEMVFSICEVNLVVG